MIDDLFQAETDAVGRDMVARGRAKPPSEPGFSAGALVRSVPRAAGAAVAEFIAGGADVVGAYGQVAGAYTGLPLTKEQRAQEEAARTKLLTEGIDYSSAGGDTFRQRAADLMPDPQTAHSAERAVAGVVKGLTTAITSVATTGPAAPLVFGAVTGLEKADELKQKGVDLETRTKVGAVQGVAAGVSVALPVAGTTAVRTAGLVVAGGPLTYAAEQSAARRILKNAGQDKVAAQYDPFDPPSLALSTVIPGAFGVGAHVVRSRRALADVVRTVESNGQRFAKDGSELQGPPTRFGTAKGDMQVLDSTALSPGHGISPARRRPDGSIDPEDRARVGTELIGALERKYGGDQAKAMAAYNWGDGNLDRAIKKHGDAWLEHAPAETRAYVARGQRLLGDDQIATAVRAAPEVVDAARVQHAAETVDAMRLTGDADFPGRNDHVAAIERAHEQIAAGEPVRVDDLITADRIDPGRQADVYARMQDAAEPPVEPGMIRLYHGGLDMEGVTGRWVRPADRRYAEGYAAKAEGGEVFFLDVEASDPRLVKAFDDEGTSTRAPYNAFELRDAEARAMKPLREKSAAPDAPASRPAPAKPAAPGTPKGKQEEADPVLTRGRALADTTPDLPVRIGDEPTTMREAMATLDRELADETFDASLIQVAAECALRG